MSTTLKTSRGTHPGEKYRLHQCRQIELLNVKTICAHCVRLYLSNKSVNVTVTSNKTCTVFHHSTTIYKALSYFLSWATCESENICFIIPLDFGSVAGYECVRLTVIFYSSLCLYVFNPSVLLFDYTCSGPWHFHRSVFLCRLYFSQVT